MSEVAQPTAVVQPLDEAGARKLTDRIKLLLGPFLDQRDKLLTMVTEAREGDAHLALGYRSWPEYMSVEFAGLLPRLASEDRRALVGELAAAGMSTRAIAPVVGVHRDTVASDIRESAPVGNPTPDREVTGRDGKTYPAGPRPAEPERKPRRSSLPDSYRNAVYKLEKALESLERLHADDRFLGHRDELKERYWRTTSKLEALMSTIDGDLYSPSECHDCEARVLPNRELHIRCGECR